MNRFIMEPMDVRQPGEEIEPVVTADLLAVLGVADSGRHAQERAVAEWLQANRPPKVLAVALRADGFVHEREGERRATG